MLSPAVAPARAAAASRRRPSSRANRVEGLAGVPRADQRRPQLGECPERLAGPRPSRPRAALRRARAASRYVLPTSRSWVSTTASARNISHSTAQTARIARRRLSGSSRSPSASTRYRVRCPVVELLACSRVPPFDKYAVIHTWELGTPPQPSLKFPPLERPHVGRVQPEPLAVCPPFLEAIVPICLDSRGIIRADRVH